MNEKQVVEKLDSLRGRIFSAKGGWFPGKGVFNHGYSMLDDLVGEKSYFQILVLNATGKMVSRELAQWLEGCFSCLSWPDPRIWCNQIGALAGTARASTVAAAAMGSLANDSRAYGALTSFEGMAFIKRALAKYRDGKTVEDIVQDEVTRPGAKPVIVGYFRPIAKGDERIETMERVSAQLGLDAGEHLALAYEVEKVLMEKYDEGMNFNGYITAFLSDHGFNAQEIYQIFSLCVSAGVIACYADVLNRDEGCFLPQRCDDINYQGRQSRAVPVA